MKQWYEDGELWNMYEKAEELQQKARKNLPKHLRAMQMSDSGFLTSIMYVDDLDHLWAPSKANFKVIRIFSQEDLQEMMNPRNMLELHLSFHKWFKTQTHILYPMTKMWLAFVYHELYQKKWNPESKRWEKIK